MIVVADTSPLNYLILIDEVDLLHQLFSRVLVPPAVALELRSLNAPELVRKWIENAPGWFDVRPATAIVRPQLSGLDPGEREAIELALELGIGTVLIDERRGRRYAGDFHLQVTGTLGILEEAARLGKVDLPLALKKLEATNFRLSSSLRNDALRRLQP